MGTIAIGSDPLAVSVPTIVYKNFNENL